MPSRPLPPPLFPPDLQTVADVSDTVRFGITTFVDINLRLHTNSRSFDICKTAPPFAFPKCTFQQHDCGVMGSLKTFLTLLVSVTRPSYTSFYLTYLSVLVFMFAIFNLFAFCYLSIVCALP